MRAQALNRVRSNDWPREFSHVIEPAQAFLSSHDRTKHRQSYLGALSSVRARIHSTKLWQLAAERTIFSEAEFALWKMFCPTSEIAAERLALLTRSTATPVHRVIVATRASLDQQRRTAARCSRHRFKFQRGRLRRKWESLLERLVNAGYERVAQVTTARPLCRPAADRRSLFLAGAVAGAPRISWRHNRIAPRVSTPIRKLPCEICAKIDILPAHPTR